MQITQPRTAALLFSPCSVRLRSLLRLASVLILLLLPRSLERRFGASDPRADGDFLLHERSLLASEAPRKTHASPRPGRQAAPQQSLFRCSCGLGPRRESWFAERLVVL